MKYIILAIAVGLSGCAATKGTMFNGKICTYISSDAAKANAEELMANLQDGSTKSKIESYLPLASVSATALCELTRDLEAVE